MISQFRKELVRTLVLKGANNKSHEETVRHIEVNDLKIASSMKTHSFMKTEVPVEKSRKYCRATRKK
ncbi:hypothetical protein HHI36_011354, partial [Cryptolaemus montrouzieri]